MNKLFQIDVSFYSDERRQEERERWAIEALGWNDLINRAGVHAAAEKLTDFRIRALKFAPFGEIVGDINAEHRYLIVINFVYTNSATGKTKKVKQASLVAADDDTAAKTIIETLFEQTTDDWEFQKVELSGISTILLKSTEEKALEFSTFENVPENMR